MQEFGGEILFLDRSDINTDEIIPAKYLTEVSKKALKEHLLEDLEIGGFGPARYIDGKRAIITRENFGCGSSREHAPWALEVNNIKLVIAPSFARIFRQNMYNCGMLAVELPRKVVDELFQKYSKKGASVKVDIINTEFVFSSGGAEEAMPFKLAGFDEALIKAGGWVEYADAEY